MECESCDGAVSAGSAPSDGSYVAVGCVAEVEWCGKSEVSYKCSSKLSNYVEYSCAVARVYGSVDVAYLYGDGADAYGSGASGSCRP